MAVLNMLRGETEVIAVDYAGKASPWDDLAGALVQLTARTTLGSTAPVWSTLGAIQGTIAYAVVPAGVTSGQYHVTLTVILPTGEVDHSADLLRVVRHAFEDGDDPNVPVASMTSLLAQVAAQATAAATSETGAETAQGLAEDARDAALAAQAAAEAAVANPGAFNVTATGSTTPRSLANIAADAIKGRARSGTHERIERLDLSRAWAPVPSAAMTTPVPYTGNELVHPDVVFNSAGWNGYRYWMAVTPYEGTDNAVENPSIYCSHDGQTWVTPAGLTNPVIPKPSDGYLSDPDLVDGQDGRLYLFYRSSHSGATIWVTSSTDGVSWATPVSLFSGGGAETPTSPAVIFDGTTWTMFYTDILPAGASKTIRRRTAPAASGPWSAPVTVTIGAAGSGREFWHLDAANIGGRIVLLVNTATADGAGGGGKLQLAWSDDGGTTFTLSPSILLETDGVVTWLQSFVYRGTLVPIADGFETKLAIWFSAKGATEWKLGYTEATLRRAGGVAATMEGFPAGRADVELARRSLVSDGFYRPDSTTGLGVSESGHLWTAGLGTFGIANRQAYATAATNSRAFVEAGIADVRAGARIAVSGEASGAQWLMLRYADANNYWRVGGSNVWQVQKIEGGSITLNSGALTRLDDGDWIEADLAGNALGVYLNGRLVWSATDAFNATATKFGLQVDNTVTRIGAFYVSSTAAVAATSALSRVVVSTSAPPTASAALRGIIWHTLAAAGSKDDVAVCAKAADNSYAWRPIY